MRPKCLLPSHTCAVQSSMQVHTVHVAQAREGSQMLRMAWVSTDKFGGSLRSTYILDDKTYLFPHFFHTVRERYSRSPSRSKAQFRRQPSSKCTIRKGRRYFCVPINHAFKATLNVPCLPLFWGSRRPQRNGISLHLAGKHLLPGFAPLQL